MEGRFQDTGFFLTVAVGTDLIHIPSLALFEKDQIHEITGDDTDDDFGHHKLQNIASPAGIGQQKNDGLVRGGEIDGKKGSECDQTSGVEVGGDEPENGPEVAFGGYSLRFKKEKAPKSEGQGFQRITTASSKTFSMQIILSKLRHVFHFYEKWERIVFRESRIASAKHQT